MGGVEFEVNDNNFVLLPQNPEKHMATDQSPKVDVPCPNECGLTCQKRIKVSGILNQLYCLSALLTQYWLCFLNKQ